jgi:hypothetical protein
MIVLQFISYIQNDEQTGSQSAGKADDIDGRKAFAFGKISEGNF